MLSKNIVNVKPTKKGYVIGSVHFDFLGVIRSMSYGEVRTWVFSPENAKVLPTLHAAETLLKKLHLSYQAFVLECWETPSKICVCFPGDTLPPEMLTS